MRTGFLHCMLHADLFGRASSLCTVVSIPLRQEQLAKAVTRLTVFLPALREETRSCHQEHQATGVTWQCLSQGNLCSFPWDSCPRAKCTALLSWAWSPMGQCRSNSVYTPVSPVRRLCFTGGLWTWHIPSPGAAPQPLSLLCHPCFLGIFSPFLIKLTCLTQAFFFP